LEPSETTQDNTRQHKTTQSWAGCMMSEMYPFVNVMNIYEERDEGK
jgi:hypothetical protein